MALTTSLQENLLQDVNPQGFASLPIVKSQELMRIVHATRGLWCIVMGWDALWQSGMRLEGADRSTRGRSLRQIELAVEVLLE